MKKRNGRLIIISAPSGTGKSTVINRLRERHPEFEYSISCTTRPRRGNEVDGREYRFLDENTFREWELAGKMAEVCTVHENLYGTPREPIDKWLAEGKDVLMDIDVIGCLKLKKLYGESSVSIFLLPPSEDELKRRLFSRGTDSKEQQTIRLCNAHDEIQRKTEFDYNVVNDTIDRACDEIEQILGRG